MPDAAEKRCVICGLDCADAPRIRDRSGRYAHRACATRAQPRSKPPATPPIPFATDAAALQAEDEPDVMAALLAGVESAPLIDGGQLHASCSNCGYALASESIICMHCGTNAQTGRSVQTRVARPKAEYVAPTPARFGFAAIGAGVAAAAGTGIWIALALATDMPHRWMVFPLGAMIAAAALLPVRGRGGRTTGAIAAAFALVAATGALAVTPPDQPEGFILEIPEYDLKYAVTPPSETQAAAFTAAWAVLAAFTAFGLAATNPHDEDDDR